MGMTHTAEIQVRSYECDSYGHVNNAVYLNYLEHARMEFLHAAGFQYEAVVEAGFYIYVTRIDIRYKASAFLNDRLFIEVSPVELRKISGTFFQRIKKSDGTVCAEAHVSWAFVTHAGRPARIPDQFMVSALIPEEGAE